MTATVLYLSQPFAQHALIAGALVAVSCGLIGPFVVTRGMAFAVHGTSELAFTGAAAGLLVDDNPIAGALIGALIVAAVIGALGVRERERDSAIGVILAFGLGVGVLLLGYYHGFATAATNILFGNIFGVSNDQLLALVAIGAGVVVVMALVYRPLLFASVDADVASARGVPVRGLGLVFLLVLALTVTAAAQVVGTLLVLSLAITPAAAAQRWSPNPLTVTVLSIVFALAAADGGILASLASTTVKPSVFVTSFSFGIYLVSRLVGPHVTGHGRRRVADTPIADMVVGRVTNDEERIALFLDYENLAIGAREQLHLSSFDFRPVADALAERGRVVVRRAYADWSRFDEDRRMLTRHHVELIEIPQRMGSVRKNAADIKMAVDAVELCFERDYITTFVLGTGDSDFTPLVHKLRELNRRVIGIGVEASTSALLPPACDEFLFYERLEGVEPVEARRTPSRSTRAKRPAVVEEEVVPDEEEQPPVRGEEADLGVLVTQTLSGLSRSAGGPVLASMLKRAILRKDPTFSETTYGFRGFSELLRHLEEQGLVALTPGPGQGDPEVSFPAEVGDEQVAFALLRSVVDRLTAKSGPLHLSGLKTQLRKVEPDFSEKRFGYGGFLQFCKAARSRGLIEMDWDEEADDYIVRPGPSAP